MDLIDRQLVALMPISVARIGAVGYSANREQYIPGQLEPVISGNFRRPNKPPVVFIKSTKKNIFDFLQRHRDRQSGFEADTE